MNTGTITIGSNQWEVWVATTPSELSQGLGGFASIPVSTGMLFDPGYEWTPTVTTEPMLFDIDIVFIGSNYQVTEVARNVAPGGYVTPSAPVRYFLEVNASEAANVNVGDSVIITIVVASPALTTQTWSAILGPILAVAALVFLPMIGNWLEGVIEKKEKE